MIEVMSKEELELWLCGPGARIPTHAELASQVGIPLVNIADTTLLRTARRLRCLRFVLAVLRDVYADDDVVRHWLRQPREEIGGVSALAALLIGQLAAVEELVVREWRRPRRAWPMAPLDRGVRARL
jgi:chloramphenicol 3-O-phosphotransferase